LPAGVKELKEKKSSAPAVPPATQPKAPAGGGL